MRVATFVSLIVALTCFSNGIADSPIDPIPRAVKRQTVETWSFDGGKGNWVAENQCSVTAEHGDLLIRSIGNDPFLHCPVDLPGGQLELTLRVRSDVGGSGSVFWTTDQTPNRGEDKRADFQMPDDGKWLETTTRFHARGRLTDLRIDPGTVPGAIEIDWIRLTQVELHPLTISSVSQQDQSVRFNVTNHRDTPVTFFDSSVQHTIHGSETVSIDKPIEGTQPLEMISITLQCDSWPAIVRTVWRDNPNVETAWIKQPFGDYQLLVAQDASVARVYRQDQLLTTLGPLVLCDGRLPRFEHCSSGDNTLCFRTKEATLSIATHGNEVTFDIESQGLCEGPVVRTQGRLEQGLFAGLEYLGKGERSSSTLDIETDEHIRFAPDPLKVTMPLMAFVTDRASVAMTWQDMTLQPVYATPNFIDGSPDHRMTLRGRKISATIRWSSEPVEEAICWAVKTNGLPDLPAPPRSVAEQRAICLTALNGPLRTEDGWGHCVQERWERRPFSDMASTVWRLGGDVPAFGQLAHGGAHVQNGTIYFVTGRAQQWLDIQRQIADQTIQRAGRDGSYRYNGKYRRGHFEDTASGVCALPAMNLLEFAYVTGDQRALDAGLRTLQYMKRFRTPRGAQVWECPLHIPDQLASAHLVRAYVRGYELTGDPEYLKHARKWALSGVPFTYLWHSYPIMCFATPPVYGATNWIAPNWIGLPVQWVGGVYAYSLALLAPYDSTLDWHHLARGILMSAQQQQYPDGPHIGLLPDSFNIRAQRRQPADINPCALVSLQMILAGEVDFLSVATDKTHRVAAPFPVTLVQGAAHIEAKKGVKYQVIVNGQRIIDIDSKGKDIVPLD